MAANKLGHRRSRLDKGPPKSHFKTKHQVSTNPNINNDLAVSLLCVMRNLKT